MDRAAIDNAFSSLLDKVGNLLDQFHLLGGPQFWQQTPELQGYFQFLIKQEKELLLLWKVKESQGLEALFSFEQQWFREELRNAGGLLQEWNHFCGIMWNFMDQTPSFLDSCPWKSMLLHIMADQNFHRAYRGSKKTESRKQILLGVIDLFQQLYQFHPYEQFLSFLNLVEIGVKARPNVHTFGKLQEQAMQTVSPTQEVFAPILKENDWSKLDERLENFWKKDPAI